MENNIEKKSLSNIENEKELKQQAEDLEFWNLKAENASTKEDKEKALEQASFLEEELNIAEEKLCLSQEDLIVLYESMDEKDAAEELQSVVQEAPEDIQREITRGRTMGFMEWLSKTAKPKNKLAKITASFFVFATTMIASPRIDSIQTKAEASELKEDADWKEGVEGLLQDVYNSDVETTGAFVRLKNGGGFWVNINDGEATETAIDPEKIAQGIEKEGVESSQIEKVVSFHTHPLDSFVAIDTNAKEVVQKLKESPACQSGVALVPSEADLDIRFSGWIRQRHQQKIFENNGLDPDAYQEGVVGPSGVWTWDKINPEELPENSPLKSYLEEKEKIDEEWREFKEGELQKKIENTSTQELKKLLMPHLSERFQNYLEQKNDRDMIITLFGNTLEYSRGLIQDFVSQENLRLALDHQENNKRRKEINTRLQKEYDEIYQKNLKGEAGNEDIQEFINAVRWRQIDLSFEPHPEERVENIQ